MRMPLESRFWKHNGSFEPENTLETPTGTWQRKITTANEPVRDSKVFPGSKLPFWYKDPAQMFIVQI